MLGKMNGTFTGGGIEERLRAASQHISPRCELSPRYEPAARSEPMMHAVRTLLLIPIGILCLNASSASARVVRVEIISRADITGTFAGRTYERIAGRVYFAFDPANQFNKQIVDLDLAPRNSNGEVEAVSEFVMLRPKDAATAADL